MEPAAKKRKVGEDTSEAALNDDQIREVWKYQITKHLVLPDAISAKLKAEKRLVWLSPDFLQQNGFSGSEYCITTDYVPCKVGSGYTQVRYSGSKMYCHRIAGLLRVGANYSGKHLDGSHLCNNDACVNPWHIVFESNELNQSRKCCKLFGQVAGYFCPHEPPCLQVVNTLH